MQLRCGHFSLNSYLHKINKTDSNRCTACHEDRDQKGRPHLETINHFLFVCTAYTAARHEMTRKIGQDNLHLSSTLPSPTVSERNQAVPSSSECFRLYFN